MVAKGKICPSWEINPDYPIQPIMSHFMIELPWVSLSFLPALFLAPLSLTDIQKNGRKTLKATVLVSRK
jgi:hypothetical protein